MPKQKHSMLGFTLLELMVTITVAAVLLGIATPSFLTLINNNRVTKTSNEYATAFRLARSHALSRGFATFVCSSANADTLAPNCGGATDWVNGFIVFSKPGNAVIANPGVFNAGVDTLLLQSAFGQSTADAITVTANDTPGNYVGFTNNGFTWQGGAAATVQSVVLCDEDRGAENGQIFTFSVAGRMFTEDTDPANTALPGC